MIMKKCKVLFLCNGNSARSQMAEGILRWHNGEQFEVFSAGVEPKGINPLTIEVMIFPNADPMMMPTAMSSTFPFSANSLNSFNMILSPFSNGYSCL